MRAVLLVVATIVTLSTQAFGWLPYKQDGSAVFSADGRFLAFERQEDGGGPGEVVVVDLKTRRSWPVSGTPHHLAWKDNSTFALTNSYGVSVVGVDGKVLASIWGDGGGSPHIPHIADGFFSPSWQGDTLRFTTRYPDGEHQDWEWVWRTGDARLLGAADLPEVEERAECWQRGAQVLYLRRDRLYLRSDSGTRLVRLDSAVRPAFSPKGDILAVCATWLANFDCKAWAGLEEAWSGWWQNIYTMRQDGSDLKRLTTGGGTHPVWHPNGEGLAYVTPKGDLAWINRDGSGFTRLVKGVTTTTGLMWAPDGRSFLVQKRTEDGVAWYRINPPSKELKRTTDLISVPDGGTTVLSPSGKMVAWLERSETEQKVFVLTKGARGKHDLRFARDHGGGWCPSAAWSPDERKLAVTISGGLWLIDVASGMRTELTGPLY